MKKNMENIQNITSNETIAVRHPVLRAGKTIESCYFDGDNLLSTQHFGLFSNDKIIAVVSLFKNKNSIFKTENQFQIRGMAVLPEFQKKGYGALLVKHCEAFCNTFNETIIWFNAREKAVRFYEKLGYEIVGDSFTIVDVGLHFLMAKKMNNVHE